MLAAKMGVAALGTIAAATTTYLLIRNADPMPGCISIAEDGTNSSVYSSKLGNTHKHLLASKTTANRDWWKWSHRRWLQDSRDSSISLSEEFGITKIKGGKGADQGAKPLEEVCDDVYKKADTEITLETTEGTDNKKKLARDLFRYCSPMGGFPTTLSSAEEYHTSLQKHSSKLVAVRGNDWFWDRKTKEFYDKENNDLNGHNFFKKLHEEERKKAEGLRRSLSKICGDSYKSGAAATNSEKSPVPKEAEILKYCSLKGS